MVWFVVVVLYQVQMHSAHPTTGDEVLRQGIITLFEKPADEEDGGLMS